MEKGRGCLKVVVVILRVEPRKETRGLGLWVDGFPVQVTVYRLSVWTKFGLCEERRVVEKDVTGGTDLHHGRCQWVRYRGRSRGEGSGLGVPYG